MGNKDIGLRILNFSIRWRMVNLTSRPHYTREKSPV